MTGGPLNPEEHAPEAAAYIATQNRAPLDPLEAPDPKPELLAVLAGALAHHDQFPGQPVPAIDDLPAGWTGYGPEDAHAIYQLVVYRILHISPLTPPAAMKIDNGVVTFHSRRVRCDPNTGAHAALSHMVGAVCTDTIRAARQRSELTDLVIDIEIRALIGYTDALLTGRHGRAPLTGGERTSLADSLRAGVVAGYTAGQLVCLLWRSAGSAVAWEEAASAAGGAVSTGTETVATFTRKLARAREERTPVPEYDLPAWADAPAALAPARFLLHRIAAATDPNPEARATIKPGRLPRKRA